MTNTALHIVTTQEKPCSSCMAVKPLSEFHRHRRNKDGRISQCKDCVNNAVKKKSILNPELTKARVKRHLEKIYADPVLHAKHKARKTAWNRTDKYYDMYFKKRFGITFAEVNSMLSIQNGLCANIGCSRPIAISPVGEQVKACVDHCHATGKVRSMMCTRCNTTLGHIENDRAIVMGLMDYLNKHS